MEFAPLIDAAPLYASGLLTTLQLLVAAFGLGRSQCLWAWRASAIHGWRGP